MDDERTVRKLRYYLLSAGTVRARFVARQLRRLSRVQLFGQRFHAYLPPSCSAPPIRIPHPCGYLGHPKIECTDAPQQVANYRNRLSGPLMDRIDIHVDVPAVTYDELRDGDRGETSAQVRERVDAARALQRERFGPGSGIHCNAQMSSRQTESFCAVDAAGHTLLERVIDRLGMSARAHGRILKVARTIADLAGSEQIEASHLAEAIQYRSLDRRT